MWKFKVPLELIINMDETNIRTLPEMKKDWSAKHRQCPLVFHKKCVTMCMSCTAAGEMLNAQVIWHGQASRSERPRMPFVIPTHSKSRWSSFETIDSLVCTILLPHREAVIKTQKLQARPPIVLLLDRAKSRVDQRTVAMLVKKHAQRLLVVWVKEGCRPTPARPTSWSHPPITSALPQSSRHGSRTVPNSLAPTCTSSYHATLHTLQPFDVGMAGPLKAHLQAARREKNP